MVVPGRACLKNVFDVLFYEWAGKPAVVISYYYLWGVRGQQGGRAVGAGVAGAKDVGRGLWRRVHD
jgi:NAD(P)H-dependent FMN reductase